MLKKKLGPEAIERDWDWRKRLVDCFKISPILIIPEVSKGIGSYAFDEYKKLERVVIPKSVELIEYCAFYDCNATIILQKPRGKFNFIASSAFRGCKDVKEKVRT